MKHTTQFSLQVNLPSGKLWTTKGLSFLWIKERRMLVVDSAGVQSTVSYRAQAVDAIHDAQTTESLMFGSSRNMWPCSTRSTPSARSTRS